MKNTVKKLQKRTVFIFKSVNKPIRPATEPTTTSTDPTTVLTTTANTSAVI
ncbi:hypothetical protein [Pedobacter sp. SG908]|uniref:hypothetical protein n=1 Tax=Pedobacter sp. SG908 TaxID=2587135 RepID=UPI001424409E|nr:hypothetical protein [Pedobacter sp. SG908]NII83183.1 hypothetical protein [Pedobacter sp. SG908]